MENVAGNAGIKDIARALKVSIATVDRAFHGRPGVSEKTKARVLQMAKRLGYKPNLAARALKLNRRVSICAVLPKHISHFFDPLRAGIRDAAAAAAGTMVSLELHEFPRLGLGDTDAIEHALQGNYDGMIFLPGDTRKFDLLVRKITRCGTAVMCIGSEVPSTDRIGSVATHAYISGSIAAELLALKLPHKANVAIFSGELFNLDHAEKLRGFAATLAVQAPHLTLLPALESHERPEEAYRQALTVMQGSDHPEGLYVSTANSIPVLWALDELGLLGKVQVITTDLFHELVPFIEFGKVLATLYQRPYTQGKVAFESLLACLRREALPQRVIRLAPHVIFRSNLSMFSNRIIETDEERDRAAGGLSEIDLRLFNASALE